MRSMARFCVRSRGRVRRAREPGPLSTTSRRPASPVCKRFAVPVSVPLTWAFARLAGFSGSQNPERSTCPSTWAFADRGIDRTSLGFSFADPGARHGSRNIAPDLGICAELRGLDLNQRPLGYEIARTGSADAYPLVTGGVRCSEITSDYLSQPQFSHKNSVSCPRASRPQIGLIHCETETFRTLRPWAAAFT